MKKTERAELHIHTKFSDDISVIEPNEALKYAVTHSNKAIAFTNLNNVQDFPAILEAYKRFGDSSVKVIYGAELRYKSKNGKSTYGITVLVKNQLGIKELYKIISSISSNDICDLADLDEIKQNRKNLLIGSCGNMGELYEALADGQDPEKAVELYDYFEIYPTDDKHERDTYKKIYELGVKLEIPVVATGNCHYLNQEDEICRRVVQVANGHEHDNKKLFYHTTDEMIEEFSYLGKDAAYKSVITDTNKIADLITQVSPLTEGFYHPVIENAYEQIEVSAYAKAKEIYGNNLPGQVSGRLENELEYIKKYEYASDYWIAYSMVKNMNNFGYHVGTRGSVGAVFTAFLLDISDVNPLPAHYYCRRCHYIDFEADTSDGFNLPKRICPVCGRQLLTDGHNIPYETFMGYDGSKQPDIELLFPGSQIYREFIFMQELFGVDRIVYAGAVGTLHEKSAQTYITDYESQTGEYFTEEQRDYICEKLCGVKQSDGFCPGGIVVLPQKTDFEDFIPLRKTKRPSPIKNTTYFDYNSINYTVKKFNVLGYNMQDMFKLLEDLTGVSIKSVVWNDPKVYSLFEHADTPGINEFDTDFLKKMLLKLKPQSFDELVRILGISRGGEIWYDNIENLLNDGYRPDELPVFSDDVFLQLLQYGLKRNRAYQISEYVWRGKMRNNNAQTQEVVEYMRNENIPEWYIRSLCKIRYLHSKAHAVAYVMNSVRMAWYKIYYPTQFYIVSDQIK